MNSQAELAFVRCIHNHTCRDRFSWQEVLAVLEEQPEWLKTNCHPRQKVIRTQLES